MLCGTYNIAENLIRSESPSLEPLSACVDVVPRLREFVLSLENLPIADIRKWINGKTLKMNDYIQTTNLRIGVGTSYIKGSASVRDTEAS